MQMIGIASLHPSYALGPQRPLDLDAIFKIRVSRPLDGGQPLRVDDV